MKRAATGQSTAEYATLIAAVALALGVMATYVQQATNAAVSNLEDDVNVSIEERPGAPEAAP